MRSDFSLNIIINTASSTEHLFIVRTRSIMYLGTSNHFFVFSLSSQTLCMILLIGLGSINTYSTNDDSGEPKHTHTHLTCDYFPGCCCTSAVLIKTIRPTIFFCIFVFISNALSV